MAVSDPAGAVPPAAVADAAERQLDPRFIPLQRTIGWIVTAVIATGSLLLALVVWAASGFSWLVLLVLAPAWMAVNAAFAWLFHRWPQVEYRHTFYRVDDEGIEIRRGVYWRVVINVPRSRVQHTDVSQGPLERKFGLGTLVVYTAGTDHARVDLGGLDHADAMRIRAHLLPGEADDAV